MENRDVPDSSGRHAPQLARLTRIVAQSDCASGEALGTRHRYASSSIDASIDTDTDTDSWQSVYERRGALRDRTGT